MERDSHAAGTHLARIAQAQYGVFTRRQYLDAGFTRYQLRYRIRNGEIVPVDYSVYRNAATPVSWSSA